MNLINTRRRVGDLAHMLKINVSQIYDIISPLLSLIQLISIGPNLILSLTASSLDIRP